MDRLGRMGEGSARSPDSLRPALAQDRLARVRVTVRLFGSLREAAGAREIALELADGARVEDLRKALLLQLPAAARLGSRVAVAVNQALAAPGTRLAEGDEVALLPPVSGGSGGSPSPGSGRSGRCTLSDQPLDVEAVAARVAGPDAGGVVTFVGRVRNQARGRTIERLEYEAYAGMAERELEKIAAEAASRWSGARVAVAHRTGNLGVGEVAVVVVAAAPHRAEAFDACRFTIDELKHRVPIWKKEIATDGEYWIEDHP